MNPVAPLQQKPGGPTRSTVKRADGTEISSRMRHARHECGAAPRGSSRSIAATAPSTNIAVHETAAPRTNPAAGLLAAPARRALVNASRIPVALADSVGFDSGHNTLQRKRPQQTV